MKYILILALVLMGLFFTTASAQNAKYDVVVYGATPAGVTAAVNAAREGVSVAVFEELYQAGGILSGGLGYIDFRTYESLHGSFREYMDSVLSYYTRKYGSTSRQVKATDGGLQAEPHVAREIFERWMKQHGVAFFPLHRLQRAIVSGDRISAAVFQSISNQKQFTVAATVFIDATYEGDLMAAAGCEYRLGRESRETYGEIFAGKVFLKDGRFLLGSTGEGDKAIQGYNFRVCLTDSAENGILFPKPIGYNRDHYLPLLNALKSGIITDVNNQIVKWHEVPNRKFDVNDRHMASSISLARPGWSWDWPEGNAEKRKLIFQRHYNYTVGFFYFLQNDPEVPGAIRDKVRQLYLPKDEFLESGLFTPALYVREGRRLDGVYTFVEKDCQQAPGTVRGYLQKDAVAVGDYGLNSHGCDSPSAYHPGIRDGAFSFATSNLPYQVPYGVMVPKKINGLLVPVAISSSHVGYSALRYEPIWTALGQAAGLAAAQAVKTKREVRSANVAELQNKLHKAGAITVYFADVKPSDPWFGAFQYFGTRGFFHGIPQWGTVPFKDHLVFISGQYTNAFPYHEAEPTKPMDSKLAAEWLKMAGIKDETMLANAAQQNRAQFLMALYQKLNK